MSKSIGAWYDELENLEKQFNKLNWCCKLILDYNFKSFIEEQFPLRISSLLKVQYCPMCGNQLTKNIEHNNEFNCCIFLYHTIQLDGMQYVDYANDKIHRILINYCFVCGRTFNAK